MLKVSETFLSLDGEVNSNGVLKPSFFIRLYGCNLSCEWCDTEYSHRGDCYLSADLNTLVEEAVKVGVPKVTITGGEPLLQADTEELICRLLYFGFHVSVETNGSLPIPALIQEGRERLSWVIDYKSDQKEKMLVGNHLIARPHDWVKFLISNDTTFDATLPSIKFMLNLSNGPQIALSPTILPGEELHEKAAWLAGKMIDHSLWGVTLNLQFHKIIWPGQVKGR